MKTPVGLIFFLLWMAGLSAFAQNGVIILDNGQAAFEGIWSNNTSSVDRYGDDYLYAFAVTNAPTSKATYRPNIKIAGKYHVDITYPKGQNRSTNAPWTIVCKGGRFTAKVNQTEKGGQWMRIGTALDFDAGTNGFVQLVNSTTDAREMATGKIVVIADAVRFVSVDSPAASIASFGPPVTAAAAPTKAPTSPPTQAAYLPPTRSSDFTLEINTTGLGTASKTPDLPGYVTGATVTLTARAAEGYVFGGWTGDANRMLNPLTLEMNSNKQVTANFWEAGIGIIMDETDATLEGNWIPPEKVWPGARNDSYRIAYAKKSNLSATYRPDLPKAGPYDVWVWYIAGENRTTNAPWEIVFKGGKTTVPVNQTVNGGKWFLLTSDKEFDRGTNGYVRLTNQADPASAVVVADGVAFVYVGPR
jgi:uncharacterized repeat protein (TIGR02543 family)